MRVCGCADSEQDDEEEGLEVEERCLRVYISVWIPDMEPGWRCTIVYVAVERLADGGVFDGCGERCR